MKKIFLMMFMLSTIVAYSQTVNNVDYKHYFVNASGDTVCFPLKYQNWELYLSKKDPFCYKTKNWVVYDNKWTPSSIYYLKLNKNNKYEPKQTNKNK